MCPFGNMIFGKYASLKFPSAWFNSFLFVILLGISYSATAINTEKYYPVVAGATWKFERKQTDDSPVTIDPPSTRFSDSIQPADDLVPGNFRRVTTSEDSTPYSVARKDPYKGIIHLDIADSPECSFSVPPNTVWLPRYMTAGREFTSYLNVTCTKTSSRTELRTKLLGIELIKVLSGTYRALVILRVSYLAGKKISEEKIWFGKGIGIVKSVSTIETPNLFNPGQILHVVVTKELISTNLTPEENEEDEDDCDCVANSNGVKINYSTGAATVYEQDISRSAYSPLSFSRIYKGNSGSDDGSLGSGWSHNYARSASVISYVALGGPESIQLSRESGAVIKFINTNGVWSSATDLKGKIAVTRNGSSIQTISYRNSNDEIESYNASGKLQSITHLGGAKTTLAYSTDGKLASATDSSGRKLLIAYDTAGRVASVTPSNGQTVGFTFGTEGQLETVTLPEQKTRKYAYEEIREPDSFDAALRIKSIEDQNGSEFLRLAYDEKGRVKTRSFGAGVGEMAVDYSDSSLRKITDALSTARTITFAKILGRTRRLTLSSACGECEDGCTATRAYDAFGNIIERTDFNGVKIKYEYDTARSLQTSRTEAHGTALARTIKTRWHSQFRQPESRSEPLRRTTFTYDANGNVLKKTVQATADSTGTLGFSAAVVGEAQTTTYTYDTNGHVLTVTGPSVDVVQKTTFTYDMTGNLIKITDPVGQSTVLTQHDADGRPGRVTMPDGAVFDYTFTSRGLLATTTATADGRSEVTTYEYDDADKVKSVALPDQRIFMFAYDKAQRLKEITDHIGNRVEFELDGQGNRTSEKVYGPNGTVARQLARGFDTQGRLKQQIGGL